MRVCIVAVLAVLVGISVDSAPQINLRTGHFVFSSGIGRHFDAPFRIQAKAVPEKKVKDAKTETTKEKTKAAVDGIQSLADRDDAHTLSPPIARKEDITVPVPTGDEISDPVTIPPIEQEYVYFEEPQKAKPIDPVEVSTPVEAPSEPSDDIRKQAQAPITQKHTPQNSLFFHPFFTFQDQHLWNNAAQKLAQYPELLHWLSSFDFQQETVTQQPEPAVNEPAKVETLEPKKKIQTEPVQHYAVEEVYEEEITPDHHYTYVEEPQHSWPAVTEQPIHEVEETTLPAEEMYSEHDAQQASHLSPLEEQDLDLRRREHFVTRVASRRKQTPEIKQEKTRIVKVQEKKHRISTKQKTSIKQKDDKKSRRVVHKKAKSLTPTSNRKQQESNFRFRQTLFPAFSYSIRHVPGQPSRFF